MTENTELRELLQEYIIIEPPLPPENTEVLNAPSQPAFSGNRSSRPVEYRWTQNETKILIDLYAKYRKKIGTFQIRNVKMMWQKIADELGMLNIIVSPNNCINRWKVLERSYKKFIDDQNKTGRGRKYFEYEVEMGEIFGRKKNVHPDILLSSDTVDNLVQKENIDKDKEIGLAQVTDTPSTSKIQVEASQTKPEKHVKKTLFRKNKTSVLENIRMDKKLYYEERLKIEREKLEEVRKRNKLIEERNMILKEQKCNCQCNPLL